MVVGGSAQGLEGIGVSSWCWKKIWNLNIPPKWALFLWKILHRILSVRAELIYVEE